MEVLTDYHVHDKVLQYESHHTHCDILYIELGQIIFEF